MPSDCIRASAAVPIQLAHLPAVGPTGGAQWLVPVAEARVLGLICSNYSTNEDGEVGFANDVSYTFDPNNRTVSGKFDFIGVAEHEISEVMGRCGDLTTAFVPYDLFRFTNNAGRSLDPNANNAYFSIDNGATVLKLFYTNQFMGDIQDWKSSGTPDSYDAFTSAGHLEPISSADITALDVLGYNGPGVAAAHLVGTNLANGNFQLRFVNSPGFSFSVLSSTNLSVHLTNWTVLGTATESSAGQYQFIDTSPPSSQRFYDVRSP